MRVCVFAGSSAGARPEYRAAARALGGALAARGWGLVYGGGSVGLMGVLADATLAAGGEAVGIIPRALAAREIAHQHLTELRVVETMHERKAQMADLADAFVALPGGAGTFDELFEIITWAQLGLHAKPIGLVNAADYFAPLLALVAHATAEGFIRPEDRELLLVRDQADALLDALAAFTPRPRPSKWLTSEQI
ncbi:MAG TPA: TIGR00730 family Rossman fold protein [Ktedonobacterales bacterium]|nr:TIGR00730 family Rossman fold protein [Ktedonobacterales bacterium]